MKSLYLRAIMVIACAVGLSACGGSSGTLVLGGQINNLTKSGLILTNNNGAATLTVEAGAASFAFPELISTDDQFNVTIKQQPTGAVCSISGTSGAGKANLYNSQYIVINCVTDTHPLGGTVTGLTTAGLILVNGAYQFAMPVPADPTAATPFVLSTPVADGAIYGITILQQPVGQTCQIEGTTGIGTMGSVAINPIVVTCTTP